MRTALRIVLLSSIALMTTHTARADDARPARTSAAEPAFAKLVGLAPNGTWLLAEDYDGPNLFVISAESGIVLRRIPARLLNDRVEIAPDGTIVAVYKERAVAAWDALRGTRTKPPPAFVPSRTFAPGTAFKDAARAAYMRRYEGHAQRDGIASSVRVLTSRDGRYAIVTSGMEAWEPAYDLWDVALKRLVVRVPRARHGCDPGSLAEFDSDGRTIVLTYFTEGPISVKLPIEAFKLEGDNASPLWHWHCRG